VNLAFGSPRLATNAGSCLAQFAGPDRVSVGNGARNLAGTELRPVHLSQTRKGVSSAAQGSTGSDPIRVFVPTHTRSDIKGASCPGQGKNPIIAGTRL
jgi:hypothetical protein